MNDCLFCAIAAGELKAEIVHETPDAVAFLDRYPAARGHVMVIPRIHAPSLVELPDEAVGGLFLAVKAVMRKVSDALHPVAVNVGWNQGKDAGQHVFHLHVHVLPRHHAGGRGVQVLGEGTGKLDLARVAEAIRSA
jgi:histidine triad (HIT) family protein